MSKFRLISGLMFTVLLLVLPGARVARTVGLFNKPIATPRAADRYSNAITTARAEIWKDINSGAAGSAQVAIMDAGRIVFSEEFGMADREKSISVQEKTVFNIGSVSKAFEGMAMMVLVDRKLVSLDDPVTQYIPEFTMADPRYKNITVRMLLNHTSGIPGTSAANIFGFQYNPEVFQHTLESLAREHLRHDPGQMAAYTNDGFTLGEMVVERASGRSYVDFLNHVIFQPLSLQNTGRSVGDRPGVKAAAYYEPDTGKQEPLEAVSTIGSGGLSSTAEDLVRFADALSPAGNIVLSAASLAEMTKPQPPRSWGRLRDPEEAYGLGLDFVSLRKYEAQGIKVIGKSGGVKNYNSMILSAPDYRLSVTVIETGPHGNSQQIALDILDAVLQAKGIIKRQTKTVSKPPKAQPIPSDYTSFDGYYLVKGSLMKVSVDTKENRVNLSRVKDGVETPADSAIYNNGSLYSLADWSSSIYLTNVGGRTYMVQPIESGDFIMGVRLEIPDHPQSLRIDIEGKQWLRRNVMPFESVVLKENHLLSSRVVKELPGYVQFAVIFPVDSPDHGGMVTPELRDQLELWLVDKGGQTWVEMGDWVFMPAELAGVLSAGKTAMTIQSDGYNQWLQASDGSVLSFQLPSGDRVFIFSPDGVPVYDSAVDQGDIYVAKGSLVEFAGYPGDVLGISAQ